MSCFASHRSGEESRLTGRRFVSPARSSADGVIPERPRRLAPGRGGGRFATGPLGLAYEPPPFPPSFPPPPARRSSPVCWFTSLMLSAMRVADRVVTLTQTLWSRRVWSLAFAPFCDEIMETCTSPSNLRLNSVSSTKHPKSMTLVTLPR